MIMGKQRCALLILFAPLGLR